MPNEIQHIGIVGKSYNSRGLITHNLNTKALVRQTNGTLWAAVRENNISKYIGLYRSTNLGFSWERVWSGTFSHSAFRKVGIAGLNFNGPSMSLNVFEQANRIVLWASFFDTAQGRYDCEPFVFTITDPTTRVTTDVAGSSGDGASNNDIVLDSDQGALDVTYNENTAFLTYVTFSVLTIKQYRSTYQTAAESTTAASGSSYFNIFSSCASPNGYVDVCVLKSGTTSYTIQHRRYTQSSTSFGSEHQIVDFGFKPDLVGDFSLSRDSYDNLLLVYGLKNAAGTDIDTYYSISINAGVTWTIPVSVGKQIGHSKYTDANTGQLAARSTCIGGVGGFLLSYVQVNPSNVAKTFVRTLSTSNGTTYTLGTQAQIATHIAQTTEPVVGLRWFQPMGARLLDLNDPGLVRVAYQVGEGNSTVQLDTVPVKFGQELLKVSAYTSTLDSDTGSYSTDIPLSNQVLVDLNVVGGAYENVDYYALGMTGRTTERYLSSFANVGNEMRLLKYEPLRTSEMNDRSSYDAPTEYTTLATFDPLTYDEPLASRGIESYRNFLERDTRKIFLPPDFHLDRTFLINKGNFLKRTVWITQYDGNTYEISQVVPFFIRDQICYYSANAYVVGPSNDPFSKSILPSET